MLSFREIKFDGLSDAEILALPRSEVEALILIGEPLVFTVSSALILGTFKQKSKRLHIELAQVEGGGEGVLLSFASLAKRYARLNMLSEIEWVVHAVTCANPNPKLRLVLEHRGFTVRMVDGIGEAYHLIEAL